MESPSDRDVLLAWLERVLANQQRIIDILATLCESRRDEPPRDSDQLIAEKEAATLLGISRLTLLRQRKEGKISFVRIGSRVLYRRADLDHFVTQRRRPTAKR